MSATQQATISTRYTCTHTHSTISTAMFQTNCGSHLSVDIPSPFTLNMGILKKNNLDASQPKNFRPVSNLPYLSKLLERVVQTKLQRFLDDHNMMPTHQSAYRKFHSTETALLQLYNNLLVATDRGQVSGLCLLDLTAAFDTVDHELLLQ